MEHIFLGGNPVEAAFFHKTAEGSEVVRRMGIMLLLAVAMPALAQMLKQEVSAVPPESQSQAAQNTREPGTPTQSGVAPTATRYPLDAFQDFSAVMVGSSVEPGGGVEQSHIYRSGRLMRMEEPGKLSYFITDLTTGETYGMLPTGCVHDRLPYFRAIPFRIAATSNGTVTRAFAGKETVNGHSCRIENVTIASSMLANPMKMRMWEAEDLKGFPIKIEFLLPGGHDPILRYKNVALGPQDPTLFIHPKTCQELP